MEMRLVGNQREGKQSLPLITTDGFENLFFKELEMNKLKDKKGRANELTKLKE